MIPVVVAWACGSAAFCVPSYTAGARLARPPIQRIEPQASTAGVSPRSRATVKVMTMNVAHGRGDGYNQLFRSEAHFRTVLGGISGLLRREQPDVVALQEADGRSFWSGGFDHVGLLAEDAGFSHYVRAEQVKAPKLSYGTALLSDLPLSDATSVTFKPSPPTPAKGFLVGTIGWPSQELEAVDVVSLHLDFARASVRHRQSDQLVAALSERGRPLIVMGDFNCELGDAEPTLRNITEGLGLTPYHPAVGTTTYPASGRQLDWILVSSELEFVSYTVLPDVHSDHRFVAAEIAARR